MGSKLPEQMAVLMSVFLVLFVTGRVKEGVFSALQFDVEGRRVLDLFAGTGQMGIECLSRGAASAVFVDRREDAARLQIPRVFNRFLRPGHSFLGLVLSRGIVYNRIYLNMAVTGAAFSSSRRSWNPRTRPQP